MAKKEMEQPRTSDEPLLGAGTNTARANDYAPGANQQMVVEKKNTVKELLDRNRGGFLDALPKHLDVDRFLRIAMTTIRLNPALGRCNQPSLIAALMQSAQLGLEPDGILGHAYLIPYGDEAKFQVGYKGLIALARRSGEIQSLCAHVVYERDKFDFAFGLNERLDHIPASGDRGNRKAVYAIAKFKDGGHAVVVLFADDINKLKEQIKAKNRGNLSPAWREYEDAMWEKTALIRLAKFMPVATDYQRAAAYDERNEMGISDEVIEIPAPTPFQMPETATEGGK